MPCYLKTRVLEARDLPVMDRSSELTDAYVEVKFGDIIKKTEIRRKTLNPVWNEDFRIEVPNDSLLQDIPVEFKVWDYDVVSANDIIGIVYIDLNCLLMPDSPGQISGWFPIYDTLKGIRGELNIIIKLEFFGNVNEFKDTSAGVQFFSSSSLPYPFIIEEIQGFVEELILDDDPEYDWVDSFRASRISNEERQLLLYRQSGKLRRQLGIRVLGYGGNAVIGYIQQYDLEGESGIVARGYGTICRIRKQTFSSSSENVTSNSFTSIAPSPSGKLSLLKVEHPLSSTPPSSGSDISVIPTSQNKLKSQEVHLITLRNFHSGTVQKLGGLVMARSIKLLTSKANQDTRDTWWKELREEVQSHAKFLGCNCVIGYTETNAIERGEGLCILTVSGTAAVLHQKITQSPAADSSDESESVSLSSSVKKKSLKRKTKKKKAPPPCSYCHIPYKKTMAPFSMKFARCAVCKKRYVPEILLTTIECPPGIPISGKGCFLEARVCREKKHAQGEQNAKLVSEAVPFVEYDLHTQLVYKLKVLGMNAAFGLKFQLAINEGFIVAVATATAVFLSALPPPPSLQINRNVDSNDSNLRNVQQRIEELSKQNILQSTQIVSNNTSSVSNSRPLSPVNDPSAPSQEERERKLSTSQLSSSSSEDESSSSSAELESKSEEEAETFVVQIDDQIDEDIITVLLEPSLPHGFSISSTETLPNSTNCFYTNLQLVTAIRKMEWNVESKGPRRLNQQIAAVFHNLYSSLMFRLRSLSPCVLAALNVEIQLPEENEVQIILTGMVLAEVALDSKFGDDSHRILRKSSSTSLESDSELQFSLETPVRKSSDFQSSDDIPHIPQIVQISPMSFIPGGNLVRFVGRVNLHLVKESFTIREQGGLGGFTHVFIAEINAILRAHVAALGGNVLLGFHIDECTIVENSSKNQSYTLISVGGDAFYATHTTDVGQRKIAEYSLRS